MSYLQDFYEEALKNKKAKLNTQLDVKSKVSIDESNNADFYGTFTSLMHPELKDQVADYAKQQANRQKTILNAGLSQGMSYEDISAQSGIPLSTVESQAQQLKPGYGEAPKDKRNLISKAIDTINPLDSGRSLTTATPSAEAAQKSVFQQGKETGTAIFSGVEKVGDSVEALTGITERRLKHWDEQLKAGKITRQEYQKLLESQMNDTAWAGTQDKGTGDRLRTAAGVSLEATSEIVPFLKAGKAAQLTTKGGAVFGGLTGAAHGTGQELNNPEGFDWKNVGLQTAIGTGAGAVFGKMAQTSAETKQFVRDYNTRRVLATIDGLPEEIKPITDTSRLLSATTQSTKTNLTTRLGEIDQQLNDIRSGKAVNTTYEPKTPTLKNAGATPTTTTTPPTTAGGTPDMRTQAAKRQGTVTPEKTTATSTKASQLKALVKEREQLMKQLDAVESGSGPLERVVQINDELSQGIATGNLDPAQTANLMSERQTILQSVKENPSPVAQQNAAYVQQQIDTSLKNQALLDPSLPSPGKTPKAAQRLADANGFTTDAKVGTLTDTMQDSTYYQLKQSNPEVIDQIVKGKVDARQYGALTNEHVLKREAQIAAQNGDVQALKDMANGPVLTKATLKGQETSSLRDLISPVKVMKDVIEARKAALKTGAKVPSTISDFEAEQILAKTTKVESLYDQAMAEMADGGQLSAKTRLKYGQAKVDLDKYAHDLMPGKTIKEWVKHPWGAAMDIAGTSKSLRATADLSGILRQGAKLLASGHYRIWARNTLKSLKVAVKSFGDEAVMDAVNADIVSRPNYLNGLYKKMGIPLYDIVEEAFPGKSLGKVPFLRKLYAASDTSYTSFMQLNRADLADMYIEKALKAGVDLNTEGKAIGSFVNSLSSRASLGMAEGKVANVVNNVFFSPRLMKSNFDVLGGHVLSGGGGVHPIAGGSNFVRKYAALNLLKIAATTYGILKIADEVRPNSVEWDPRSSNYGKIKIGNTRFDVTGGMSSLVTLGSRLATGESKSSTTDIVTKLNDESVHNGPTYSSVLTGFAENKLSPAYSALQDIIAQEDFSGKKPTAKSTLRNLTFPIVIDNYNELKNDPQAAPIVASMILEGLGVSTNTYDSTDDWTVKTTASQKAFKQAVGDTKFKVANDLYNKRYTDWFRGIRYTDQYKNMDNASRRKLISQAGDDLEKQVMQQFGFTYKRPKTEDPNQELINSLNIFNK